MEEISNSRANPHAARRIEIVCDGKPFPKRMAGSGEGAGQLLPTGCRIIGGNWPIP